MSYTNLPTGILAGSGITITPTSGTGSNTITISASGIFTSVIRNAVATPVVVNGTDEVVSVQVPGPVAVAVAVNLPAGITGRTYVIKDGLGLAAPATPITITPAAGTIDGAATATINVPYGSLTLIYNGTQWLIL